MGRRPTPNPPRRDGDEDEAALARGTAEDVEAEAVFQPRGPARVFFAGGIALGLGNDRLAALGVGGEDAEIERGVLARTRQERERRGRQGEAGQGTRRNARIPSSEAGVARKSPRSAAVGIGAPLAVVPSASTALKPTV